MKCVCVYIYLIYLSSTKVLKILLTEVRAKEKFCWYFFSEQIEMKIKNKAGQPLFFPSSASAGSLFRNSASALPWSAIFKIFLVR